MDADWMDLLDEKNKEIERLQIKDLPLLLEYERKKRKLSLRDVEDEIGIGHATLSRVERGYAFDIPTLEKIVAWLGLEVQLAEKDENQCATDENQYSISPAIQGIAFPMCLS